MSASTIPTTSSVRPLAGGRLPRQGFPLLVSALLHAGLGVILSFLWIVVGSPAGPPEPPAVGATFDPLDPRKLKPVEKKPKLFLKLDDPAPGRSGGPGRVRSSRFDGAVTPNPNPGNDPPGEDELIGPPDPIEIGPRRGGRGKGLFGDGWGLWVSGPGMPGRVVYVLDASGSMLETFDLLLRRLAYDLGRMRFDTTTGRGTRLNVIFFRDDSKVCWEGLRPATPANRMAAFRWARRVRPRGHTDPQPALAKAFAMDPECIVVLSDGEFDAEVLRTVAGLQARRERPVVIHTIGYGNHARFDRLRALAGSNGGRFRRIEEQ